MISTALLNTDGSSAIAWSTISRVDVRRTLGTLEERADVRPGAARRVRRYTMGCDAATGAEVEAFAAMMAESGFGAEAVRWRHPQDDAAALAADCPLFRVLNPSLSVSRGAGGVMGRIAVQLEEL